MIFNSHTYIHNSVLFCKHVDTRKIFGIICICDRPYQNQAEVGNYSKMAGNPLEHHDFPTLQYSHAKICFFYHRNEI